MLHNFSINSDFLLCFCVKYAQSLVAHKRWVIKSTDVISVFLKGQQTERVIYLKPSGNFWKLIKSFYLFLKHELLHLGCSVSSIDPSDFYFLMSEVLCEVLISHIDDLLHGGNQLFEDNVLKPLLGCFLAGKV